ncbi:hypothetical protein I302_107432 [Kwoniella bestiolae CBS 10118]|uniref:Uncharacterized protein n=1 Tax=Kwoniella bestiolae CBS 10118 TaxID=1296100 RepID=A0A1B9FYJ5_9TREE|nr:hypothetical protein I302_06827 [Kwoniella bestiolae CBS 10118]OCF23843.1 hypothetical protein I302_06827 [Kwoniella bestiolae CBS 10118]
MFTKSNILIGVTALGLMGAVNAQTGQPEWAALAEKVLNALISEQCQTAITTTFSPESDLGQCQFYQALAGITDDASLDSYLNTSCGADPCTDESLTNAANTIWTGCQTEMGYLGITRDFVYEAFGSYSVQREISCLKKDDQYCLTYLSQTLNSSASDLESIDPANTTLEQASQIFQGSIEDYLCNECSIAYLDLILVQYPELASLDLGEGKNVVDYANGYCAEEGLTVSTDGTLPQGITKTAHNSNFPAEIGLAKRILKRNIGALKTRFLQMI